MALSRRAFLGAAPDTHFASLVVHCRPEQLQHAREAISQLDGADVPASDDNCKLVVMLELSSEGALLDRMSSIEQLDGVIAATMVFHQIENLETESGA